jgi:hypothetical protein
VYNLANIVKQTHQEKQKKNLKNSQSNQIETHAFALLGLQLHLLLLVVHAVYVNTPMEL